jgi:F-type H+-transporting ATPase subunit epsilon
MNSFPLLILAAEKTFYDGDCVSLVIPTPDGQYGIMANHTNMISAIAPGMMKITDQNGEVIIAAVSEGLIKIENNQALLLVDTVERPEEIDENRAKRSAEEAKEAMLQKQSIQDYYAAQAKMARAINRLKVKHYNK